MDVLTYLRHFTNSSSLWRQMEQTVEDSPWHRESDVATHTQMVLDEYERRFAPHRTERQNTIARLALAFHDVGKPGAEETLEKKDGSGTYRRYAGHEQLSAVFFTETWLEDPHLREVISLEDARKVRFIIEHHLPYGYKDAGKRSALRTAVAHTLREDEETFFDCLRSDAAGRISDDHETKLQNVETWIAEFKQVPLVVNKVDPQAGRCYVLIGPSGSGKSTWISRMKGEHDYVVSLDEYRLRFYDHDHMLGGDGSLDDKARYDAVWKYCVEHEGDFRAFVDEKVKHLFQDSFKSLSAQPFRSVFIDNVNSSKKARARWVQEARRLKMKVVAVEFWNTLDTVLKRQETRTDKRVPESSVRQQHTAQTCAWLGGEVDEVIVVTPTGD